MCANDLSARLLLRLSGAHIVGYRVPERRCVGRPGQWGYEDFRGNDGRAPIPPRIRVARGRFGVKQVVARGHHRTTDARALLAA